MAIIRTITCNEFVDAFRKLRPDNFSRKGLEHLYEYLEQLSEDIGDDIELDVIALCCDYLEECVYEAVDNYGLESIEDMEKKTLVIMHDQINAVVLFRNF